MVPGSTYRVQLHGGFGFDDAAGVAGYLAALGITHLYCSPILQAAAGSTHGYDVVDPQRLSAELGGAPAFARLLGSLRDAGLGLVLDVVPNHLAADPANRWWWDVLENGPASRYASFFDIDWASDQDRSDHSVLVPVLGDHYGRVLDAGELAVVRSGGRFVVRYFQHRFPLSPRTAPEILSAAARQAGSTELAELADSFGALPAARVTDQAAVDERHAAKQALATALEALCERRPDDAAAISAELDRLNEDPDRLDALLRRQNYRLAYWRTASEELDYRRFFNIESLVALRIEDPLVFDETHRLVLELVREGSVDGLRIDHVDGLRDPEGYLALLAAETGGAYTVAEKILSPRELLPASWPVAGTTGYDFLNRVNDLFVASENEAAMTACYEDITGEVESYADVVHQAKHQIMAHDLAAEVDRVTGILAKLCDADRRHRDHTRRDLRDAVREVVAAFPVYRTYVRPGRPASDAERCVVAGACEDVAERRPDLDRELLALIAAVALGDRQGEQEAELAARLQQLTAPVTAKGVEDTAFYRYHRLVSLNEVGGDPGTFGRPVTAFHEATAATAQRSPHSMLTLSTHDTKRSADVRARLNVLSEMPGAWREAVERWVGCNDKHRRAGWPDRNAEYLLYQTLVGAWPIEADRVVAFMSKATKEAKVHTSWVDPVDDYDDAIESFVRSVLADACFVDDLERFLADHRLIERGRRNALAQMALLLTSPGVPDIYQGTEAWDLSLVDPDNRRPIDFARRRHMLEALRDAGTRDHLTRSEAGGPKLWLVQRLLAHRQGHRDVYDSPAYQPLVCSGPHAEHVVAYARDGLALVAPCRTSNDRAEALVELPPGRWIPLTGGEALDGGPRPLDGLLAPFPVAVLVAESTL